MAGSKGGKPGQWSARKAQLLATEYRKAGGGYRGGLKKTQRSLKKWTREKWTTRDKKPAIRKGGTRRYLPAKAWNRLTPAQRRATDRKKILGSRTGDQFIKNTEAAQSASRSARK
jgi:UTP:GlnB (protein PII) uridylyltransferase